MFVPKNNIHRLYKSILGSHDQQLMWADGAVHDSDTNCSSVRSSAASSEGSFRAKADFLNAVAKAAQMSGLTVVNSNIIDQDVARDREKGNLIS